MRRRRQCRAVQRADPVGVEACEAEVGAGERRVVARVGTRRRTVHPKPSECGGDVYLEFGEVREPVSPDQEVLDGRDEAVVVVAEDVRVRAGRDESLDVHDFAAERHAQHNEFVLLRLHVGKALEAGFGLADCRRQVGANEPVVADGRAVEDDAPPGRGIRMVG